MKGVSTCGIAAKATNSTCPPRKNVIARFHDEHQRRYGYHHAGREIELVTLRLRARLRTPQPQANDNPKSRGSKRRGQPRRA